MLPDKLQTARIGILGFGVNNRELTRWLIKHGARDIVIIDDNPEVSSLLTELNFPELEVKAGPKAFRGLDVEIAFRSPGIPLDRPELVEAKNRGVELTSQTELFLELCPARVIGVTGTKGKGTTSTLLFRMLEKSFAGSPSAVYLAGNIGRDPFEFLDELTENDLVILELSSFQLEGLKRSPHIAVVLGITSDHLDYHPTLEHYRDAKTSIVRYQTPKDSAIFNLENETAMAFAELSAAQTYFYSRNQFVEAGSYLKRDGIRCNLKGQDELIATIADIQVPGAHNLDNILAAITAAKLVGATNGAIKDAIKEFTGVANSLEKVAEFKGISWYNDSAATGPTPTMAAIKSFLEPIILIAGGSDKGADYNELGQVIASTNVKRILSIGLTGPKIAAAAEAAGFPSEKIIALGDLSEAVATAEVEARAGDVVLLSPASASFDQFPNYKVRGQQFIELVREIGRSQ